MLSAVLFLPQLLFSSVPERLALRAAGAAHPQAEGRVEAELPAAVLVEGAVAARNAAAAARGVRIGMTGEAALGVYPTLQFARASAAGFAELAAILTTLAHAQAPAVSVVKSAGSGATALFLTLPADAAAPAAEARIESLSQSAAALGFVNTCAVGSSPETALRAAVVKARGLGLDWDAEALLRDLPLRITQGLPVTRRDDVLQLRASLANAVREQVAARLTAAFMAWADSGSVGSAEVALSVRDRLGRPILPRDAAPLVWRRPALETESAAAMNRVRHAVLEAVWASQGSLELTARPMLERSSPGDEPSTLAASLTAHFGRARVFQISRTAMKGGMGSVGGAQRRTPAGSIAAHPLHRPGLAPTASKAGTPVPSEVFPAPRELALEGLKPVLNGPLSILRPVPAPEGSDPERHFSHFMASSAAGELLCVSRDLRSGRWYLEGRFA